MTDVTKKKKKKGVFEATLGLFTGTLRAWAKGWGAAGREIGKWSDDFVESLEDDDKDD